MITPSSEYLMCGRADLGVDFGFGIGYPGRAECLEFVLCMGQKNTGMILVFYKFHRTVTRDSIRRIGDSQAGKTRCAVSAGA